MRYKICLTTLVVMLSLSGIIYSQPQRLVSPQQAYQLLQDQIQNESNPDSVIEYYTEYGQMVMRSQPDSLLSAIRKIKELKGVSNTKKQAHSNYLNQFLYRLSDPEKALEYSQKSYVLFDELGEDIKLISILHLQSQIQAQLNRYLQAEESLIKAIDKTEESLTGPVKAITLDRLLNSLTNIYMRVGAVDIAIKRYQQMLEIETSIENECRTRLSVSNAFKRNEEIERAKTYLLPCLNNEAINVSTRAAILRSMSDLEKILGNNEKRISLIIDAIEAEKNAPVRSVLAYQFLAEAYFEDGLIEKSDSVLSLLNEREIRRTQPFTQIHIGILKSKILSAQNRKDEALQLLNNIGILFNRLPQVPLEADVLILKSEILSEQGDYKKAYELAKESQELRDLVAERAKVREEAISKVRFQMRDKNLQIAQVTTELGTVKTRNAIIVILLLMAASYIIYRYRIYFLLQEERTRNKIASDLHDDLSATLSSISFFSEAAKKQSESGDTDSKFLDRIDESAAEAKEKINDIIWAIDPENDDWAVFLTKCKRYAAEMFESKDIAYTIEIDENMDVDLDIKKRNELWMIFKELVTNLVRHSEASEAKVEIKDLKNTLSLIVEDNGRGFNQDITQDGNGVKNIKNRVGSFGKNSAVNITSEEGKGTTWNVILAK